MYQLFSFNFPHPTRLIVLPVATSRTYNTLPMFPTDKLDILHNNHTGKLGTKKVEYAFSILNFFFVANLCGKVAIHHAEAAAKKSHT